MAYYITIDPVSTLGPGILLPKTGKKAVLLAAGAVVVTVAAFRASTPSLADGYMIVREFADGRDDVILVYKAGKYAAIKAMLLDGLATYTVLKHPDAFRWVGIAGPET